MFGLNTVSIPFDQGDVFRHRKTQEKNRIGDVSIPFDQGDVFRHQAAVRRAENLESQSLSIRAMSFDIEIEIDGKPTFGLNPFRSGRCLSTKGASLKMEALKGLNPFRSGRCLSTKMQSKASYHWVGLNPFRSGRCLSTVFQGRLKTRIARLNPFRSGRCLSTTAVCWRQESCGLSDPLPNFFGRLRSWLLI